MCSRLLVEGLRGAWSVVRFTAICRWQTKW